MICILFEFEFFLIQKCFEAKQLEIQKFNNFLKTKIYFTLNTFKKFSMILKKKIKTIV